MKADKSLEEVWKWKEKVYDETKGMSVEEYVNAIKANASNAIKKYGLNLEVVSK